MHNWQSLLWKALLDLSTRVIILPYLVFKQFGIGEPQLTNVILEFANWSVKISKGMVKDVFAPVKKFYFPIDLYILETEPI